LAIQLIWDRFSTLASLRSSRNSSSGALGDFKENRNWGLLDIGANIGTIAVPAAEIIRKFGSGSVTAVEAVPLHAMLLRKSIDLNNLDNILVIRNGISDQTGLNITIKITQDNRGGSSVIVNASGLTNEEKVTAVTVTIDEIYKMYPKRLRDILILKLDVECYEGYALVGAMKFLEEVRPCWIMVELVERCLNRRDSLKYQEILDLLKKFGYLLDFHGGNENNFRHDACCKMHKSCIFK